MMINNFMKKEQILQRQCFDIFRLKWPHRLFIHVPNERKNVLEVIWLKAQGTLTGCPDIFIPEPIIINNKMKYAGLWIELKIKPNKPKPAQMAVMQELSERGYAVAVCWNIEEFMKTCEDYFNGQWQAPKNGGNLWSE